MTFADSKRLLVIVTAKQCGSCAVVKSQVREIAKVCSHKKIDFLHITGDNVIGEINKQHLALISVCRVTPSIFSITNIVPHESFDYVMSTLDPSKMKTRAIVEWWKSLTTEMHDKSAKYIPPNKKADMTVGDDLGMSSIITDLVNLSYDDVNLAVDTINR